ncbi:hypothetical protein V1460_05440 [Streptomyces sp. SCSIO 30461]|uniref:hypothetical protein n=1 Tax=Streptomyces sp. SCSIO 30461 TaxID=3118085 RepID=UPI0030CAF6B4
MRVGSVGAEAIVYYSLRFTSVLYPEAVPANGYASPDEYVETFLDFLDRDIRWAAQGNLSNPAKAADDAAWRDMRGGVIEVVDFGGLLASSHRTFPGVYTPHHNRLCQGGFGGGHGEGHRAHQERPGRHLGRPRCPPLV